MEDRHKADQKLYRHVPDDNFSCTWVSDTKVRFAGGGLPGFGAEYSPVTYGIATRVQPDGCTGSAQAAKEGMVACKVYTACRAGTSVELVTIEGLGHLWPSLLDGTPLSNILWDFFAVHPKP